MARKRETINASQGADLKEVPKIKINKLADLEQTPASQEASAKAAAERNISRFGTANPSEADILRAIDKLQTETPEGKQLSREVPGTMTPQQAQTSQLTPQQ